MSNVIIADDFFSACAKLSGPEKGRVFDFLTEFRADPASPGIRLERVRRAPHGVWSGRISEELRAILYKDGDTWAVLHADHHDAAYGWAERRNIGRHPVTGILQIVETVETIKEVERVIEHTRIETPPLFAGHEDAYLVSLGLPESWLPTLRKVRDDEQLFRVCEALPSEVGDRLLDVADGKLVTPPAPLPADRPAAESPEVRSRFYVADDEAELRAILNAPMERWIAFLHPSQRALVEGEFKGPVKVSGSAGTGKTVVALHRARHLARQGHKVLLTSFVTTLCRNMARNVTKICAEEVAGRITVDTVHKLVLDVVRKVDPHVQPAGDQEVREVFDTVLERRLLPFDPGFVRAEWEHVVEAQGLLTWDEYRSARRTGRGRPLSVRDRKALWSIFDDVRQTLAARRKADFPALSRRAEALIRSGEVALGFDAVLVDEVQDLKVPALRFLQALAEGKEGRLMLTGDAGQRIYPGGFSLGALGIEVRGRSHILRINYRTTEQIRRLADRLLGDDVDDLDGGAEPRKTRSVLRGPEPVVIGHKSRATEIDAAVSMLKMWMDDGLAPGEIAVFTRTGDFGTAVREAAEAAGVPCEVLARDEVGGEGVAFGTMHRAKGLEFKAVMVLGCSAKMLPHAKALLGLEGPERDDAEAREKRLLYVAMTRARDELVVSYAGAASPFIGDLALSSAA